MRRRKLVERNQVELHKKLREKERKEESVSAAAAALLLRSNHSTRRRTFDEHQKPELASLSRTKLVYIRARRKINALG